MLVYHICLYVVSCICMICNNKNIMGTLLYQFILAGLIVFDVVCDVRR
jgi:hypothetical protein